MIRTVRHLIPRPRRAALLVAFALLLAMIGGLHLIEYVHTVMGNRVVGVSDLVWTAAPWLVFGPAVAWIAFRCGVGALRLRGILLTAAVAATASVATPFVIAWVRDSAILSWRAYMTYDLAIYASLASAVWGRQFQVRAAAAELRAVSIHQAIHRSEVQRIEATFDLLSPVKAFDEVVRLIGSSATGASERLSQVATELRRIVEACEIDSTFESAPDRAMQRAAWPYPFTVTALIVLVAALAAALRMNPASYPVADSVRVACEMLPAIAALPFLARIRGLQVRLVVSGYAALATAAIGELLFFTLAFALGWPVPPPFSATMLQYAFTSLAAPFYVNMTLLAAMALIDAKRWAMASDVRAAALQQQLGEARLNLLKFQLQPHFLFNSLQSVSTLLRRGETGAAREMLERLKNFYAAAEALDGVRLLPLHEELNLVRQYLSVQAVRFGERLAVAIEVKGNVGRVLVPPLILQPLVENAIKYGVARHRGAGWVRIEAACRGDRARIVVSNNSRQTGHERDGLGVGDANTRGRLETAFGTEFTLQRRQGQDRNVLEMTLPASA